eukprot:CAMPEP_0194485558 /NCGR_PEP_ID=MMETSP0253-20130528/6521_1 /TAXON_ID=2966 /ORGANISM="Noctiluca scintillans" /LENGTH=569 /DNA_ID=CAMNT_0039325555 /DNA_START=31 /DNA_END=1740 /DNA_ORIENTATION=-
MVIHKSPFPPVTFPKDVTLTEYIFAEVATKSSTVAFVDGSTQEAVTCGELWKRINRTASGLQQLGVKKDDVVAIWSTNNVEYVVAFHGVILAGGIVTTLNPTYTSNEVAQQLDLSGAKYMVVLPSLAEKMIEVQKLYGALREVLLFGGEAAGGFKTLRSVESASEPAKVPCVPSEDVCVLPFSSGTTGLPKGVMLTHTNIVCNIAQCTASDSRMVDISSKDVLLAVLPFYHIYGMVILMNIPLKLGAKVVTLAKFEPVPYMNILKEHKVSIAFVAPPIVQFLAKAPSVEEYLPLPDLRVLFCAAAPLGEALTQAVSQRIGTHIPVRQGYGMTELSPVAHCESPDRKPTLGSVGQLIPNMECKLVDPETGKEQGAGASSDRGELWVRGPNVMKGYFNNKEATDQTIDADGWLHTGDIAYVDANDTFFIVDRLKELIKTKGFQVAPAELEAILVKHPDVADAAVIGVPAERYGGKEGDGEVPKAFIIRMKDSQVTQEDIAEWFKPLVAPYKAVRPNCIEFVDSLPKVPSGKILRKDLRAREEQSLAAANASPSVLSAFPFNLFACCAQRQA